MMKRWLTMPSTWKGLFLLGSGLFDYIAGSAELTPYVAAIVGGWETVRKERLNR